METKSNVCIILNQYHSTIPDSMFYSMFPMDENWFKVSKKEKDTSLIFECFRGVFFINFEIFRTELEPFLQREKIISFIHIHKQTQFKWVPITFSE